MSNHFNPFGPSPEDEEYTQLTRQLAQKKNALNIKRRRLKEIQDEAEQLINEINTLRAEIEELETKTNLGFFQ